MDFFDAVKRRRSLRRYTDKAVPAEVMRRAFEAAQLAPNSSNLQVWEFFWVKSPEKRQALVHACLNQGAARTAKELVVVVARWDHWKENRDALLGAIRTVKNAKILERYYEKLLPILYSFRVLSPLKWLALNLIGFFRPIMRRPASPRDLDEVAIKSAALAAENFMLAIAAQEFDTCPMEGFDEPRVRRVIGAKRNARVVMVISVGERDPRGIYGEQFRFPLNWFVKEV